MKKRNERGKRPFSGRKKSIAVSMWYRAISDGAPTGICNILQHYHDSAMATL